jgi:hypothetical protein
MLSRVNGEEETRFDSFGPAFPIRQGDEDGGVAGEMQLKAPFSELVPQSFCQAQRGIFLEAEAVTAQVKSAVGCVQHDNALLARVRLCGKFGTCGRDHSALGPSPAVGRCSLMNCLGLQ